MNFVKSLSISLFVLAATSATAGEFYENVSPSQLTQNGIEQGAATNVNFPPAYSGTAGQFKGTFGAGSDAFLRFFCFEGAQNAGSPAPYALNSVPPAGFSAATYKRLQQLYDLYYPRHGFNDFYDGAQTTFGLFASNTDAAAFQLAVWRIVFGDALDPGTNSYSAQASGMLALLGTSLGYQNWHVYTLTNGAQQDFVTAIYRVPEPGSLALAGLALAGLGFVRRRRI